MNTPQTPEEQETAELLTPQQFTSLQTACELLLTAYVPQPAVHAMMKKLYYNSILASFKAGQFVGVLRSREIINKATGGLTRE